MALKKSELYSSLGSSCDELRGGMDASQYKDYVLVLLFIKYISDKYAGMPYAPITIPPGSSFKDMVALKGKPDIGDQINKKIIGPLANANKLSDMPDFNDPLKLGSGKEMVERLTNLIAIFENKALDFSKNRAEGDDILGDAYEYLMRHFATESGKKAWRDRGGRGAEGHQERASQRLSPNRQGAHLRAEANEPRHHPCFFAISKLGWIKQQKKKLRSQERETPREYLDRESHYVWGRRYLLKVVEERGAQKVELKHSKMILRVSAGTGHDTKREIVAQWYREQIKAAVPALIAKWEPMIGVNVKRVFVQKMKTKWGGCNPRTGSIRLNSDLAKKPRECLEYVVVHEMVHLLEHHHNDRFKEYMRRLLPQWRVYRDELNSAPLAHESWGY